MIENINLRLKNCNPYSLFLPQTGADVLFVMNYPGYVAQSEKDEQYHLSHPGLGYKYSSEQVAHLSQH
jgi:hypothetical protein